MKKLSFYQARIGLITLATLLATTIATYCKLPYGFLSVVTAYVLLQMYHEQIYLKTLERILGPTFAFLLAAVLLLLFKHYFYLYFVLATCLVFLAMYYYAREHHAYAMLLGGVTIAFISTMAYIQNISNALQAGFYWISNIFLGSLLVIALTLLYRKLFSIPTTTTTDKPSYQMLSTEYWQQWRLKSGFEANASLIAGRITLTLLTIVISNYFAHWSMIDVQALIAGTVVSAQFSKAHHRAFYRLLGVLVGAGIALSLAHVLAILPTPQLFLIFIIPIALTACALASEKFPAFSYTFLQAGVMLPIILIHQNGVAAIALAQQRTLGSLEGGLIGVIFVYLSHLASHFFISKKT